MRSPWQTVQQLEPDRDYLALVTDIPPLRLRSTGRWFRGAQEVKSQLRDTDGVLGFSLLASPLRKRYLTLSVWADEEALARFSATGAHGRRVHELQPEMASARFLRWTFAGHEGRPTWREAVARIRTSHDLRYIAEGQTSKGAEEPGGHAFHDHVHTGQPGADDHGADFGKESNEADRCDTVE